MFVCDASCMKTWLLDSNPKLVQLSEKLKKMEGKPEF